jgi:hypothetical protein
MEHSHDSKGLRIGSWGGMGWDGFVQAVVLRGATIALWSKHESTFLQS